MSSRKRNEFLDADESEGENTGYESDDQDESRVSRAVKRRRISQDDDKDSGFSSADEDASDAPADDSTQGEMAVNDKSDSTSKPIHSEHASDSKDAPKPSKDKSNPRSRLRSLNPDPLEPPRPPTSKTGVIYLSRVPPFMKPSTVKGLLSPYGSVTRLFLTPEDPIARQQRLRGGGNKKRSFTDGWVEFARKRDAKLVAETLNANIIGGKKGSWYHDDVWNIRYLKGFKWHHLTEQIANENAERAARLRRDIAETRKEDRRFVQNVERAKMLEGMEKKKVEKRKRSGESEPQDDIVQTEQGERKSLNKPRHFKQNKVRTKESKEAEVAKQPEEVARVLSKIF